MGFSMRAPFIFILIAGMLVSANQAFGSNLCFSLLASPSEAERAMPKEERIGQFYSLLLEQYRGTMDEAEYVQFLEKSLQSKSYFEWEATAASQFEMKKQIESLKKLRQEEQLPGGERITGAKVDDEIRVRLVKELGTLRKTAEEVETSVKQTKEVRAPTRKLVGHTSGVNSVYVSPDFKRAVSGSADGPLIVWNLESGEAIRTLKGHTKKVKSVQVSSDFKQAVSGSADGTLIVWDFETGEVIRTLKGHRHGVTSVQVSSDFKRAVSGSRDRTLIVWNLETGEALQTLSGHTGVVSSVQVSPDFKHAVSGSWDGTLIVWDLETGEALRTLTGHTNSITSVQVSSGFKPVGSGSEEKTLFVWGLEVRGAAP